MCHHIEDSEAIYAMNTNDIIYPGETWKSKDITSQEEE